MKTKKPKISKKTLSLIAVALVLFAAGGLMQTQAQLQIFSQDYRAEFELDHLQIHLLENDIDVCDGKNTLENKTSGILLGHMGYDGEKPGTVEPGRPYQEEIAAMNGSDVPEYVRLTIRKYWRDPEQKKDVGLDPAKIELTFGKDGYNSEAWVLNPEETTAEATTYYYRTVLDGNAVTKPVVNTLRINESIASNVKETRKEDGDKTTITYVYKYNGYEACIEADVQSIQTHNVNDAIESLWGVENVSASDGTVTVE